MDATTQRLVDYALQADYAKLPPATVHECKRRLIDTFACVATTYFHPVSRMARAFARRYSGNPAASLWGSGEETTLEGAAFANAVAIRYQELNDVYMVKSRGHPSDVIAGILAVAEATGADGKAVINTITLAYDVFCTFCETVDINVRGLDQSVYVGLASVIAAGKLLGLTRDQLGHAVSLALPMSIGLHHSRRGALSNWKGCSSANASANGIQAALLARDGFTGPPAIFEGDRGLWHVAGKFDWQITVNAQFPHRVARTHMKNHLPIAYHGQSAVDATLAIRDRVRTDDVTAIRVETYRQALEMMASDPSHWAPKNRETADHSMPYVVSVALTDGTITEASFTADRLQDPRIAALMAKVTVHEDPALTAQQPEPNTCRLKVSLRSGSVIESEAKHPKGHIENPLTDADLELKFRELFRGYGSDDQCAQALRLLSEFESAPDVGALLKAFITPQSLANA
jgi:2-methylcitrate dehydratase